MKQQLKHWLGVQSRTAKTERMVASVGAIIGITAVYYISYRVTGHEGAMAILPSMGAAAVLLFAVPHGPLSQPWALLMGNLLSAVIGVSCAQWISEVHIAAAMAVGLSILAMHWMRAIHPPGGATALAAVIGGSEIHDLGYAYVLVPTILNCLILLSVAVIFNYHFRWRRYPLSLMHYDHVPGIKYAGPRVHLHHIEQAMDNMDILFDISAEEVKLVLDQALQLQRDERISHLHIESGGFYTNARSGRLWAIRQIVDEYPDADPQKHLLIYRTVDGAGKGETGTCTCDEFAQWAKERVKPAREKVAN